MSWNSSCLSVFRWRTSNASLKPDSLSSCSFFVFFYFCFVILIVFTFLVPCCDVHYEFCLKRCSVRLYLQLFVRWLVSYCVFFLCLVMFNILSYHMSLRSVFCAVMSAANSVRLNLQLFVGGLMSYLRYLCLFVYVEHILTIWVICRVADKKQFLSDIGSCK